MQRTVVLFAGIALIMVCYAAYSVGGEARGHTLALATLIGAIGGISLYHAAFGFTGAWRRLQNERRGAGVRAQIILVGLIMLVCYPLIAAGVFGRGWVFPIGASTAIGALIFGFGMQLGGGCGSGTLFTVGGGSSRMWITLVAFIGGSVLWTGWGGVYQNAINTAWGAAGFSFPSQIKGVSLLTTFGLLGALAISGALLAALWLWTSWLEKRTHGNVEGFGQTQDPVFGPWSKALGAAMLAFVVIACFAVLNRPWGITGAFAHWGVKSLDFMGAPIAAWNGWSRSGIERSVFADATGVMNFGVMLGALAAAGLAGRFAPSLKFSFRDVATAVVGGLLMGFGARAAFGCNIGGLVGGLASASLHGWWWLLFGAAGSIVGVWFRYIVGLDSKVQPKV